MVDHGPLQLSNAIPPQVRQYTDNITGIIEKNVDRAAEVVRENLSTSQWIPESVRPTPPLKPVVEVVSLSRGERLVDWAVKHKILTGIFVVACGAAVYKGYQATRSCRKTRRAKRARNGGRTEVIVVAGSPSLPLTRSLALDMERRGFMVYIVCNAAEDEGMVLAMKRPDIRPLSIDTTDVSLLILISRPNADIDPSHPMPALPSNILLSSSSPLKLLDPE